MAINKLTNTLILGPNKGGAVTVNTVAASTVYYIDADQLDERTVIYVTATSGAPTITIEGGSAYAGGNGDLVLTGESGKPLAFTLDSARYSKANTVDGQAVAEDNTTPVAGMIKVKSVTAGTLAIVQPKV